MNFIKKMLDPREKEMKEIKKIVNQINSLEKDFEKLTDEELKNKTFEFKERLKNGENLDSLLPEAFATVRETSKRVLGMRHYDVQLIGGIILHRGYIAEMKTGEGKTLVATAPVYLNALEGKGVHVVTTNDYLAERDATQMGQIYNFLGLTVGVVKTTSTTEERRNAYNCDITYGTSNEFAFDFLRNNLVVKKEDIIQRPLNYVLVDEIDSILIDEARNPLIISGPSNENLDKYYRYAEIANILEEDKDYKVLQKEKVAILTEEGVAKIEKMLGIDNLYSYENIDTLHKIQNAVNVKATMFKDVDYVVINGEVLIVDEFTGRLMPGRRFKDGVHQAIEAKEGVQVKPEQKTQATITFQHFFRLYRKLSGMTGTALTEEEEFMQIYNLPVYVVPTHKPVKRKDLPDIIFRTEKAKNEAIIKEIIERHTKGQPVLVGTNSIEKSELLSQMLKQYNIPHNVLNAKNHKKEAEIVSKAGEPYMVTIATNMAGRGTDIKLGKGVEDLGGLCVIGTTRHESRRVDNQLRGRSGRQGDKGVSMFFVSLEDDLFKRYGGEKVNELLEKLNLPEDKPIQHKLVSKFVEQVQLQCESYNFQIRKNLTQLDNVISKQREIIYSERNKILDFEYKDIKEKLFNMFEDFVDNTLNDIFVKDINEIDYDVLLHNINIPFFEEDHFSMEEIKDINKEQLKEIILNKMKMVFERKESMLNPDFFYEIVRTVMLKTLDQIWIEYLNNIEFLRKSVFLKTKNGKDPFTQFTIEAFDYFNEMINDLKDSISMTILKLEFVIEQ